MAVELPPKQQVALALLERSSVYIHLDPRSELVRVPKRFKNQPQLVLQVGLNMAVRIPDLDVDDDAVSCTLSFNRTAHYCYLPWSAIYALVGEDGRGMVWPEDVPAEVAAQGAPIEPPRRETPRLVALDEAAAPAASAPEEEAAAQSQQPRSQPAPAQRAPSLFPIAAGSETTAPGKGGAPAPARAGRRQMPSYLRVVK